MQTTLPREKMASLGTSNLTDAELLAVLLGSGTKHCSVHDLAARVLNNFSLQELCQTSPKKLLTVSGIGSSQAARLLACVELGQRMHTPAEKPLITTSTDVLKHASYIRHKNREYLVVLYLNGRQELLKQEVVSIGGLNYTNVAPREVFSLAVTLPAAYIVLVHNHPSGNVQPSQDDIEVTERICAAGQLLGIAVLDHLIVGPQKYFSLREGGYF